MRCDETGPYFESIELNKQFTVLGAGQTEQLYAKMNLTRRGRDDIAECRVDWYSNDTSIVTVSKDGLLTGVSKGTTVITALSSRDEKMDQCTVTVIDRSIPVTSIRLKSSTVIDPGKSEKLVPQFLPSDASNQNIIWESSDSTIAAVEQSGTVTAKSDGASVITVTTIDGNKTAQCSVYVYIQVEQIRLYHNPIIEIDQTMKIVPDISPTDAFNKEVTWSTSNESVVSVSPDGVITAKAIGNAVISVVSLDGLKSDQCNVTVVNKNSVTVTDIDGNIYSTVRIGNQLWTVENLKTKTLNDGTPLLYFSKDNYESPNYCIYNENNNLFNKFGALYNKSAVASGKLAPKGWRIPDHDDFEKMAVYLMKNGLTSFDRAINNAGINNNYNYIAKPLAAKTDWETRLSPPPWDPEGVGNPVEGFCPGNDLNKNNLTGFTALPGGYGNPTGGFENINIRASFWSITQRNSRDAFGIFEINFSSPHISLPHNDDYEYDPGNKCYSVRIMRDIDIDEINISAVTLDPVSLTLAKNNSSQLFHEIIPFDATNQKVVWSSSDSTVVFVANGVVVAKETGSASVTVTTLDGNLTASCMVTVPEETISVKKVILDNTSLSLIPEQTDTLNAIVLPEDATDSKIHWNSSDTNVVKVKNGVITAKTYGKATITVTTNDGEKTAKCVVTVPEIIIPVATVVLDKSTLTLSPDQTDTLNATVVPEDATDSKIHWNSSDTNVVKIKNGVITAKATGTAQITVTTNDKGKTAKCNVIVQKTIVHVAGVILSNSSLSLLPDQTDTLKAIVIPEDATDKDVTWSSSDTNIITVIDGVITAKAIGSATITVTTNNGNKVADCNIHVSENMVSVTGVILSNTSVILQPNQTDTLSVKILPENASNKKVTWSSSDTSIVSVVFGVITAKNIGNATVTVTTQDGNKTAGFEVSVIAPTVSVYSVTLDKIALVINPDSTDTIKATILPQDATNKTLSWSSSDINIVSVADGVITAHDTGTAKITVTTHDGNKTAACLVMVNLPTISVSSVTLNKTRVTLMQDQIEILRVTILPENATNKTVAWKSTDSSVVSVEDGGIVAINPGTAQIIVTSIDSRQTATCTVTVTEPFTPVEGITVDQSEVNVSVYTTHQLHETVLPENANNKNVTWTSSDTLIVKVKNGLITAIKTGTAVITVTSEDGGYSALCDVLVQEEEYGSVRDIEGNEYSTVRIGNLIWTIENLRTTKYNDNEEIPDFTGDSEAWKTDSAGALSIDSDGSVYYNWYAASNGRLAPTEGGWRIPTNDDWIGLIKTLVKCGHNFEQVTDTIYHNTLGSSIAAKSGWATNDIPGSPGHNLSENNSSRFNALPTGRCHLLGSIWENDGTSAYWWSSTSSADVIDGITTYMLSESKHLNVGATNKRHGQSIRLVKDVGLY